ncbi:MAG: flavodoxin family protein, partial [Solirubrobacterales bacterium]
VFAELEKEGIETEMIQFAGQSVHGCIACGGCFKNKNQRCAVEGDIVNDSIAKMVAADGIILASPTYFADITSETKALIDRAGYVAKANADMFRRKVGAGVIAVRRAGSVHAFDSINHFFLISQMIIPGSCYWNMGIGRAKGEVEQDEEGLRTMQILGQNMAWLLKKINA